MANRREFIFGLTAALVATPALGSFSLNKASLKWKEETFDMGTKHALAVEFYDSKGVRRRHAVRYPAVDIDKGREMAREMLIKWAKENY